jgi:hypothetical protein
MHRIGYALALALALVAAGAARASDPVGGYLIVDKVVLEPSKDPTTIQIWGSFALASRRGGNEYASPQRGYLYFKAASGKEAVCRKEWADLKKAAGTGEVIGFGTSYYLKAQGTIRKASQKPEKPDDYPIGNGLVKVDSDREYKPVRDLLSLPVPRSPAEGAVVPPGEVTLSAGEAKRGSAYAFEIVGDNGDKEKGTGSLCKGGATWTPKLKLKAGVKYTWSVRATGGKEEKDREGPPASATFVVKDKK